MLKDGLNGFVQDCKRKKIAFEILTVSNWANIFFAEICEQIEEWLDYHFEINHGEQFKEKSIKLDDHNTRSKYLSRIKIKKGGWSIIPTPLPKKRGETAGILYLIVFSITTND